jgi:hypothetical protein
MEMARAKGTCLRGRDQARAAVFVVDTWLIESTKAKAAQKIFFSGSVVRFSELVFLMFRGK